jgi:ATP-dependent Clp protease protease subunit
MTATNPEKEALDLAKARVDLDTAEWQRREKELEVAKLEREEQAVMSKAAAANVLTFVGQVSEKSATDSMATLDEWSRRDPLANLTIIFNSPGGYITHGLALFDAIGELKGKGHHVTTIVRGQAASMGGILMQAGTERVIGSNAMVLIHEAYGGGYGTTSTLEDEALFQRRLEERCMAILAERSTLSASEIQERKHRKDWWLNADEAVALGFADRQG